MGNTIDMQDLRHLSLFRKITHISTQFCFHYNDTIFFCVPRALVSRAVGENGMNVRRMYEILRKRVKIVAGPRGIEDAELFIKAIVSPVTFKNLEIREDEIILTAGSQSKASLLGRNKRRLLEMQKIVKGFFGKEYRIV